MSFISVLFAPKYRQAQFLSFYLNHMTLQSQERGKDSEKKGGTLLQYEIVKKKAIFLFPKIWPVTFWTMHLQQSFQWLYREGASQVVFVQISIEIWKNQIAHVKVSSDYQLVKQSLC